MTIPTLPGINARTVTTARLTTRVLCAGDESGTSVIFIHGNLTSATFWEETMLAMPASFHSIALDQRGFGESDPEAVVDGNRGLSDMSDDVLALLDTLGIDRAHVVGHSMGGGVLWNLLADAPDRLLSASCIAPVSPFGFGGTKDAEGTLCAPDAAGSGGGVANPQYTQMLKDGERGDGEMTPRHVMNNFYWKPPYISEREEDLLTSVLQTHTGERDYPGDSTTSENWPGVAPGRWGVLNGMAPNNQPDISRLYAIDSKPPVLWLRGDSDQVIADMSMFDLATFGKLGVIPGWPGDEVCPPQPMIAQIKHVLDNFAAVGGQVQEVVIEDCGHTPFIEKADQFNRALHSFLART
ncbi:MAG: alpha/beta hydrolase [Chloroflexi bacterium]|nr:alpha/beta hydrolase [Chloroflexota bacterium]